MVLRMAMRELLRARGRLSLLALVLAMQVMTIGGTYVAMKSFDATRDHYYGALHFADLEVAFSPAADDELPKIDDLRKIQGVRGVSRRYVTAGTIEGEDAPPWPVLVVYLDPGAQEVNGIGVLEGRGIDPDDLRGVVIDRGFADHRHVTVGSAIVVNPYRFATRFTVNGIGLSPEFLAPAVDPGFLMPAKGSLGIIYAPRQQLDALFTERLYDDLVFTYAPDADPDATQAAIVAALHGLDLREIIPRRASVGHRMLEELLRTPRALAPILALVVGLLAAIVAYVLMARIIAGQRREIGALLAIGFPAWHFVVGYLVVGLAPAALGASIGGALARVFGKFYALGQARLIGLPEPIVVTPVGLVVVSAAFAVLVTLLGALVPLLSILRLGPAIAMRGGHEIAFRGLPVFLERIVARGRATFRFGVRNVIRRARLSAAVVALVCAGVGAPATLLTTSSSWEKWSEDMAHTIPWDATVSFRVPLAPDALATILSTPGLREGETFLQGRATLHRVGAKSHDVRVRGVEVPARLDTRTLTAGRDFLVDDAPEAIVNEGLARGEAPVHVGDSVRLVSSNGVVIDLHVVGTVHDAAASTVHVPLRVAQRLFGAGDKVSGMFVVYGPMTSRLAAPPTLPAAGARPDSAEVIDMDGIDAPADSSAPPPNATGTIGDGAPKSPEIALLRAEMVVGLQSRADAVATTRRFMREQREAIFPFVAVAMFFAFAAILGVLGILLLERESEYATLRAMGYGRARIARIVFLEVSLLAGLGLGAALVTWFALSAYLVASLSKTLFPLPLDYRAMDFVTVAAPTLLFLALTAAAGVRAVLRLNLREVLTSRTIG